MAAQLKPSATGKYQQSIKTSSSQADMEKHHTAKGQAEAGRVPRYQRQPQGFRQPAEFRRGPDRRRTPWVPPERRTPVREISNQVPQQCASSDTNPTTKTKEDDEMTYLDVLNMLRRKNGGIVVEASTQATTQVPQIEFQQPRVRETEQATTLKTEGEKKMQAEPCNEVEASPQQAMIYVSELEHQQFQRQTDRITQLKNGNEALAAEMEQLKKMLQMNKTLHDQTEQKRMDEVKDLELQFLEKKASEIEAVCKVEKLKITLQRQKDRRVEQDVLLAQQEVDITKLKTALIQTQDELKSHQLRRQEERSLLNENLKDIQRALQEEKAMQKRKQQMKRVEKSPSLEKDSPSSLSKLEATISPQANPPLNNSSSMPTPHPIITSS
ncbi:hypothetical protein D5F01_LYC22023 [Larimichthys crocea]|uniref:Uncharacterized protein n=1 Tax=Larimichthys crocea TaxID=215358 RepID=A0A6G0HLI6_LARCR|nr:hypothetical protein D5F01_LYC22023 [Larimichthys crocea]